MSIDSWPLGTGALLDPEDMHRALWGLPNNEWEAMERSRCTGHFSADGDQDRGLPEVTLLKLKDEARRWDEPSHT